MCRSEICNMDIIADTGAIFRIIIRAIYADTFTFPECSFDSNFNEMCCADGRLSTSTQGVGPSDVKITEGTIVEIVNGRDIA